MADSLLDQFRSFFEDRDRRNRGSQDTSASALDLPINSLSQFSVAFQEVNKYATDLNSVFGQTRQRVIELGESFANAIPSIVRLGGSTRDLQNIFEESTLAQKRNVLATEEEVSKLYSASKILDGISTQKLVEGFNDVGIALSKIPKELENSIYYINSLGGNVSQIMGVVNNNLNLINRYQFEGGVLGLTKMAAQATMLKFDMNETTKFAEDLYKPEKAVEVASAFQRLGVSVGNLVDPFQLMTQSITDPSGLQDSLINLSKQFTYFDDKTKTFKINPQGVLILKEMNSQLGLSFDNMTKTALAAADLDRRVSAISDIGLNISEEDKQYLSNILRMTEGGEYEVKVKVDDQYKPMEISKITQQQLDELIETQKTGPKTLEDYARSQLSINEIIKNDLRAIRASMIYGISTPTDLRETFEDARTVTNVALGAASEKASTEYVRGRVNQFVDETYDTLSKVYSDLISGDFNLGEIGKETLNKITDGLSSIRNDFMDSVVSSASQAMSELLTNTNFNTDVFDAVQSKINTQLGVNGLVLPDSTKNVGTIESIDSRKFDFGGNLDINLKLDDNLNKITTPDIKRQVEQQINDLLKDPSFYSKIKDWLLNSEK